MSAAHDPCRLSNGLTVRVVSTPNQPRAAALLTVAAGSHDEPQDWPGLAHLLEHLLFGDSRHHRGDARLMPWVEAVGGAVNASTETTSTHFFFEVPAPLLTDAVQRLMSMLTWPLWSDQAAMREVAVIDAEYHARRHDGDTLVEAALAWAVADGHPLHRFCAGNLASLGGDPAELLHALRDYHQRFFHAANMTLWLQGPQSEEALRAIANAGATGLPRRSPSPSRASLPPLVWRLPGPLALCCPGMPRLVLAFALTDAPEGTAATLPLFRQLLQDEAAGGLLDQLRARGLCDNVRLLPCDQTLNQRIVALVFSLLPGGLTRGQDIAALLQQWLPALHRLPPRSLRHYAGLAEAALARLSPMRQLRERARIGTLRPPAATPTTRSSFPCAHWARWLGLLDARVMLQLTIAADLPGKKVVSQGFTLRLGNGDGPGLAPQTPPARAIAEDTGVSPLAAGPAEQPKSAFNFYPFPGTPVLPPLPARRVRLRHRPAPRRRAVLLMRPQTGEAWDDRLGYCIQSALRTTAGALAHRGGLLSFQPIEGRWTLLLSAAPAPMMGALAGAIDRLRSLTAAEYQQGLWRRQADWLQRKADIPARALLQALAQWLDRTLPARDESLFPAEKPRLDGLRWQALLYGGESTPLARLLSSFPGSIVPPASPAVAPLPPNAWLQVSSLHSEAALLVFCPQPARSPSAEAAWRLLALLYQPRFFQHLRVVKQIGYIVSCRFHHAADHNGILFLLQSPQCDAAALYSHLQDFLADMSLTLATLSSVALVALKVSLTQALAQRPADNIAMANAYWRGDWRQRHAQLAQEVGAISPLTLGRYHQRLMRETARWWLLSNQAPPV